MTCRPPLPAAATAAVIAGSAIGIDGQRTSPADLAGVWNYATIRRRQRAAGLSAKSTLSPPGAGEYERQTIERQSATNNPAGPDWWDPGTRFLIGGRTSLSVDPADGRGPAQTVEAQQRTAARTQARRARGPADGPEDR